MAKSSAKSGSAARKSTDKATLVPTADVTSSDVLLGRGNRVLNHPGNIAFRKLVDSRRNDYVNADGNASKNEVARQVYESVKTGKMPPVPPAAGADGDDAAASTPPPGRFMKRSGGEQEGEFWVEVPDDVALEKCKMTLRQIDRRAEKKEARQAARSAEAAGGGKKTSGKKTKKAAPAKRSKKQDGNLPPKKKQLKRSDASSNAADEDGDAMPALAAGAVPVPPQMIYPGQLNAMMAQLTAAQQAGLIPAVPGSPGAAAGDGTAPPPLDPQNAAMLGAFLQQQQIFMQQMAAAGAVAAPPAEDAEGGDGEGDTKEAAAEEAVEEVTGESNKSGGEEEEKDEGEKEEDSECV